jgi:hypothetical protein
VQHLREVIVQEFNNAPVNMCRKACENVALRLQAYIDLGGAQSIDLVHSILYDAAIY